MLREGTCVHFHIHALQVVAWLSRAVVTHCAAAAESEAEKCQDAVARAAALSSAHGAASVDTTAAQTAASEAKAASFNVDLVGKFLQVRASADTRCVLLAQHMFSVVLELPSLARCCCKLAC